MRQSALTYHSNDEGKPCAITSPPYRTSHQNEAPLFLTKVILQKQNSNLRNHEHRPCVRFASSALGFLQAVFDRSPSRLEAKRTQRSSEENYEAKKE
jgi:hypothetical protein